MVKIQANVDVSSFFSALAPPPPNPSPLLSSSEEISVNTSSGSGPAGTTQKLIRDHMEIAAVQKLQFLHFSHFFSHQIRPAALLSVKSLDFQVQ